MKIVIRAVGRRRDPATDGLCSDYLERARRHVPIALEAVETDADLRRALPAGAEVVALDPGGREYTTPELVELFSDRMLHGRKAIVFLIGGADGLSQASRATASLHLSLSRLTLPHRLARVVLCEQIYRCLSSIRGEPYDK